VARKRGRISIWGELADTVDPDQFVRFLSHPAVRLNIRPAPSADLWQMGESAIRFGQITLTEGQSAATEPARVATLSYSLREERETMKWVHQEIQNGA